MGWGDHRIILRNIIGSPRPEGTRGRQVPSTLFTSPELAHVGLHQEEADTRGIEYRLVKASMGSTFLRTHTIDQIATAGFAKCLLAKNSDEILGFTALAPGAGELLPVISLAMAHGLGYQAVRDPIFAHPTLNEGLRCSFWEWNPCRSRFSLTMWFEIRTDVVFSWAELLVSNGLQRIDSQLVS